MILFNQVEFNRGTTRILSGISLEIPPNQRTVLLGRSGSGKSTLLRLINRLLNPSSGSITLNQIPLETLDPLTLRRSIGFVSQNLGLFPHWTARQQITRFHHHKANVETLATSIGLDSTLLDRYPHQLSGGQQQRVAIARALASNPPLLMLDEPFSALDPILRREMQDLILTLNKTIIFVTHDLREAMRLGHQLVFLRDGKIVFNGPPQHLHTSNDSEVQAYLRSLEQ